MAAKDITTQKTHQHLHHKKNTILLCVEYFLLFMYIFLIFPYKIGWNGVRQRYEIHINKLQQVGDTESHLINKLIQSRHK
jgi:hypothetical protein